jgi:hypothetical protein
MIGFGAIRQKFLSLLVLPPSRGHVGFAVPHAVMVKGVV